MLLVPALSVALGIAIQAPAESAAPGPSATGVPSTTAAPLTFEQKQKVKLKCEKIVQLGSRMPVRVCRTPDQIKQSQADARDTTVEFQKINPEQIH